MSDASSTHSTVRSEQGSQRRIADEAGLKCPALFISAPASNQGKTTITAALARLHRRAGKKVRVFKTGPDFLDPMILAQASGNPVYQLDLWMVGEAHCRQLLAEAAQEADLILVEGVMGLFDGAPSSADLARTFNIPVLAVVDGSAMAQTFGAITHGLASYQPDLPFAGVLANRVGSAYHAELLAASMPAHHKFYGAAKREPLMELPHRHLGLWQAEEIDDLEARIECAADALQSTQLQHLPPPVEFQNAILPALPQLLAGQTIAVARDAAFGFLYQANLDLLQAMGAKLAYFSPLAESTLPQADSLYLPGGYPELHLVTLKNNHGMKAAIRQHQQAGKPILAECGGMLYLLQSLADKDGASVEMVGLLSGHAAMQPHLMALALQQITLPEGDIRGHTYHHSKLTSDMQAIASGTCPNGGKTGEAVFRQGRLTASYIHLYFASNPQAAAKLFLP